VLGVTLCVGILFGSVELAIPAFAEHQGASGSAGVILGFWSIGSMIGGAWIGARVAASSPRTRVFRGLICLAVLTTPLLAAQSGGGMAFLILIARAPTPPTFAAAFLLLDDHAPPGTATETFAWNSTAIV